METLEGSKLTYECARDKWNVEPVKLKVELEPFQEGGMRLAYKAREIFDDGGECDVVLKHFKEEAVAEDEDEDELIKSEAMTQMVADDYAQSFNKLASAKGLSHRVAFLPVSVVKVMATDGSTRVETYSIEPYLPGEYIKYNDNFGHTANEDEVALAFCFFTHHVSGGALVVTDLQGVGTFYTDPQIHTLDGEGFGAGNLGERGIRRFLQAHRHTLLCEKLGLPSPDAGLTDEELARKLQEDEARVAAEEGGDDEEGEASDDADVEQLSRMIGGMVSLPPGAGGANHR
jgi:myosin-heavy-chain kinase